MENLSRIAVIIVNFNSWKFTVDCLESIRSSTGDFSHFKIFIVENGSSDDSLKILSEYTESVEDIDVELIVSGLNTGFACGNNLGIRKAFELGFGYYFLLNNDTIISDDVFRSIIDFFDSNSDCTIIALNARNSSGEREIYCTRRKPAFLDFILLYHSPFWNSKWLPSYKRHYMLDEDFTKPFNVYAGSGAAIAMKKVYFDKTGFLDENTFLYSEEFIIAERAANSGFITKFMPEPGIVHLGGQSTKEIKAFSYIEYCKSEKYLLSVIYGYSFFKLFLIKQYRLLKYLFKCTLYKDYRTNALDFIKLYFF